MSTPISQQIVRDTFTRANSGTLGANWTAESDATDTATIGITSNAAQVQTTGGNAASFWNANTFQANQYSQANLGGSAFGSGTQAARIIVRASAGGNYYAMGCNTNNVANNCAIQRNLGGTFTQVGSGVTVTFAPGDLLRVEVIGTTITGYQNGNQLLQVTDAGLSSGSPGVGGYMSVATTVFLTNWEGGNLLWTRQGTVIPIGGSNGNQEPSVLYEANPQILSANADGKIWKMWYSTGWITPVPAINYAESPNGITWTQYGSNPVMSGGASGVVHGSVSHIGSTYYGFFGNEAQSAIDRWTSTDGVHWTKTNSNVLLPTASTWDSGGIANPTIVVVGSTWNMLYEGKSVTLASVGLATSTDLGVTWTKYVSNPVITSASASTSMGKTAPILNGNLYYLWTHATLANNNLPSDMSLFSSPDLHTWTACSKNAVYERVLFNEGANVPSAGQVVDPCIRELNGTTYQFYSASPAQASGNFHINLATAPFTIPQVLGIVFGQNIISGNVGLPGATVNYSGPASGSVFADSAGNFVIPVSANGTYTVTPSGSFTPTSLPAVVSSADVVAINFTVSGSGPGTVFDAQPISVTLVNSSGDALSFTSPTVSGNNGEPLPVCFTDPNGNEYAATGAAVGGEYGQGTPVVLCTPGGQPIVPPFAFTTNATTITWSGTLSGKKLGQPTPVVLVSGAGFLYGLTGLTGAGSIQPPTPIVLCDINGNILTGLIGV